MIPDAEVVSLGEVKLTIRKCGTGEALLLVHGLGTSSELWCNQFETFSRGFHVIAMDLRGFGHSDKPKTPGCYLIDKFADDLIRLLGELGIGRCHYLGTSMGGFIGQTIALHQPHLFKSLILVHTAMRMMIPAEILQARLNALRDLPMTDYSKMVAEQALAEGKQSRLFDWLSKMIAANDRMAYTQVLKEGLDGFDVSGKIGRLKLPVLVVVGDKDRVIPPEGGYQLAASIEGAKTHTLKHSGHIGYAEQPTAFNDAILSFLGGLG